MSLDTSGWDDIPVWANHRSFFSFNPSERITSEQGSANHAMLTDFCLWFFIHGIAATSSFFFSAPVHPTRNRKTAYLPALNSQTLPNYLRLHLHSYSEDIIERSSCTKSHFVSPKIIWIGKYSRESRTGCSFSFGSGAQWLHSSVVRSPNELHSAGWLHAHGLMFDAAERKSTCSLDTSAQRCLEMLQSETWEPLKVCYIRTLYACIYVLYVRIRELMLAKFLFIFFTDP